MKIIKRNLVEPLFSSVIWIIPIWMYAILKIFNAIKHHEWIWWIWILISISAWFSLNYKLVKTTNKKRMILSFGRWSCGAHNTSECSRIYNRVYLGYRWTPIVIVTIYYNQNK